MSLDPRASAGTDRREARREGPRSRAVHAVAASSDGYALRFSLEPFVEPSTRAGRRFARPSEGAEIVGVARLTGGEILIAATAEARGILCKADEVNFLSGPGQGRAADQAGEEDRVLGFIASSGDRDLLTVETTPRRRADDQHRQIRGDRPRRQRTRAAAARPVHAYRVAAARATAPSMASLWADGTWTMAICH